MGRSNTLPISQPQRPGDGQPKTLSRSATTLSRGPERQKQSHLFKITHPHLSFHRAEPAQTTQTTATAQPSALRRQNSEQTRYVNMLLALDEIPRFDNILSSFFTWVLLAGFIIFPGTFTSIQSLSDDSSVQSSQAATDILKSIKHVPLLIVAGACSGFGAAGMVWLWWRWQKNYVWLLNKIFLPGCLNSLAGLISTLVNVYSQHSGVWSVTARVTAIVTGSCMVVTGCVFALYDFWILKKVKKRHGREMMQRSEARDGEGLMEKLERKAAEPALEPGSVV